MKAVVVLLMVGVAAVGAGPQGDYAEPAYYTFGYTVDAVDAHKRPLQFGHSEGRDGGRTTGKYYVLLPDTRVMTVEYYVDATGYHPTYSFQGKAVYPSEYAPPAPKYGR